MQTADDEPSWFSIATGRPASDAVPEQEEFRRIWLGFMTARVTLSLMLMLLQVAMYLFGQMRQPWLIVLCAVQLAAALAVRLAPQPRRLGHTFDRYWLGSIGVDMVCFTVLQLFHGGVINYTPLYALPVLQAAVLGSLTLALGTAAGITLLLMATGTWLALNGTRDLTAPLIQAALTGAGSFAVAFLTHRVAARLAREQQRAQRSQGAMRAQQQVNEVVIAALTDGILVVDAHGAVHAANPAARHMLQRDELALNRTSFDLADEAGWHGLADLALRAFGSQGDLQPTDVTIEHRGQGGRRVRVRTRMTTAQWGDSETLCVMFLQDQREIEARLRTEKLASMGRMSAAVAHEIRNPLAAIAQANDLLEEELQEPRLLRLTRMVRQNAQRLDRIVDDVLNVARAGQGSTQYASQPLDICSAVSRIVSDWSRQLALSSPPLCSLPPGPVSVRFDPEHLRRVLVNLLDNARRYASARNDAVQVHVRPDGAGHEVLLAVWSDGPPMDPSVEQHLFEPFFSSESRSSGLGLYICRQLCEGHGAAIGYHRARRVARDTLTDGNEFFIALRRPTSSRPMIPGLP